MVLFVSDFKQLRIILRPSWERKEGLNHSLVPGLAAQFHDGVFTTDNKEIIDLLRKHNRYGIQFREEGPHQEPQAPKTASAEQPPVVTPRVAKKPKVKPAADQDVT